MLGAPSIYAIVALCAGFLFNINPLINFWVGSAFRPWHAPRVRLLGPGRAEGRAQEGKERSPHQPVPQGNGRRSQDADPVGAIVFMLLTNTFYTCVRSADVP